MNWQSIAVLAVVLGALAAAIAFGLKHRGRGCSGDCAHCGKSCKR